jgi:hypothetical protein
MIGIFLKAKHWQLFLLTFGLPLLVQVGFMGTIFSLALTNGEPPDPNAIFKFVFVLGLLMALVISVTFGWQWSVAVGLQKMVPEQISLNLKRFKVFFFIPLIYLLGIVCFIAFFVSSIEPNPSAASEPEPAAILSVMAVIVPLHFFVIFCIFYVMYFAAKTLKTVELQKEVKFGEFAGEFFLIWFDFVGFWILQPRINKLYDESRIQEY